MKNEGKTWQEMGFKDEGEMKIIFSQFKNRAGKPRQYLQYPLVDSGIYFVDANNATKRYGANRGGADPRGYLSLPGTRGYRGVAAVDQNILSRHRSTSARSAS